MSITMWTARLLSMRPSISSRNEMKVIELLRAMAVTETEAVTVATSMTAMGKAAPWRTYSNS